MFSISVLRASTFFSARFARILDMRISDFFRRASRSPPGPHANWSFSFPCPYLYGDGICTCNLSQHTKLWDHPGLIKTKLVWGFWHFALQINPLGLRIREMARPRDEGILLRKMLGYFLRNFRMMAAAPIESSIVANATIRLPDRINYEQQKCNSLFKNRSRRKPVLLKFKKRTTRKKFALWL